jgi:multidrug efflux pump subunit AcrA (membrane-fusion protein)
MEPPPEVLVTTVTPQDVPRVLERVATLDGFINANINAQVQGYIVSRDYQEGSVVKKGDLLFQIDPRPFEAALAQAKGTLAKDKANQAKQTRTKNARSICLTKKVISDQERDTAIAAAGIKQSKRRSRRSGGETGGAQSRLHENHRADRWCRWVRNNQVGDLVGPSTGPLTTVSQIDPIKAVVTAGEGPFTDFVSRHPDPTERNAYIKSLEFDLILGNGECIRRKENFMRSIAAWIRRPDRSAIK